MNEELKIVIKAEVNDLKKSLKQATDGLKDVGTQSKESSKEIESFTKIVED